MGGNAGSSKKADERRARNLQSANASRQKRKEHIAHLTDEKARLQEANEMLRTRLNLHSSTSYGPLRDSSSKAKRDSDMGPGMQSLMRRKNMDDKAVMDMLERAVSGGKGKGGPSDPDAHKKWSEASKKAPTDVKRPLKYGSGSGSKASGSKTKITSTKKR